jgi:hypothetical protein
MWRDKTVLYLFLAVIFLIGYVPAQEKPDLPPFVPGEIILRFASKSKAAELVASASARSNQPNASLSAYIESLAQETGIPFQIKQLGSGGNLIIAIQQNTLIANLLNHVRRNPNVKEAKSLSRQVAPLANQALVQIDFLPNSCEAEVLAKIEASGRKTSSELDLIIEKVQRESGISLKAQVASSRALLMTLDLNTLTINLATRLAKLADVEFAQPNFVRGRINRAVQIP